MSNYHPQPDPQYKLRWSVDLKDKITASAKEHNRSMNADIVARLEQSFEPATSITAASTEALMAELVNRFPSDTRLVIEKNK